jgi:hypothetical protein
LTIRNLTKATSELNERSTMNVVTTKRTIRKVSHHKAPGTRRSLRELTRSYFEGERRLEFIIEALLFAVLIAISAPSILAAADALH